MVDTSNFQMQSRYLVPISIHTVLLAAQEIIYRNRQIDCTLALAQVRRMLYNQMIKESYLAKFSLDTQNFHKSGTPLKIISIVKDCQLIKVCLYGCVCCNYGLLVFNLLWYLLITYCTLSISLCCLCNALLMSLPSMLLRIHLNEWRQQN